MTTQNISLYGELLAYRTFFLTGQTGDSNARGIEDVLNEARASKSLKFQIRADECDQLCEAWMQANDDFDELQASAPLLTINKSDLLNMGICVTF